MNRISPVQHAIKICFTCIAVILPCALSGNALAEAPEDIQPVKVGDADLYLSGRLDFVQTDNKFLSQTDTEKSSGVILSPAAVLIADKGTLSTEFSYAGSYASFDDELLDFDDHRLNAGITASINKRLRAGAGLSFNQNHEELGETNTLGVSTEGLAIVTYNNTQFRAGVVYGAAGAKGNLRFEMVLFDRSVKTSGSFSGLIPDYSLVQPRAEFSYRISGDTRLTFNLSHGLYDYDIAASDRSITQFLVGLRFAATGKLSGDARIGAARTTFDTSSREDSSDFIVSSSLVYRPLSHTKLTFRANRKLDNQEGTTVDFSSGSVVSDELSIAWQYAWSSRVSHTAELEVESINRICPDPSSVRRTGSIEVNVSVLRWLSIGANVSQANRTGDVCAEDTRADDELDYDRQNVGVFLRAAL